jgi:small ligand-binding sensory domain FIST
MQFASAISNSLVLDEALNDLFTQIENQSLSQSIDLAILFTTDEYADDCTEISRRIRNRLNPNHMIGCTGGGIIGNSQEYEGQPAISLMVGALPGANLRSFYLTQEDLFTLLDEKEAHEKFGLTADDHPSFIVLPDPFSVNALSLLSTLDFHYPTSVKVGGLASGGFQPGCNRLYQDGNTYLSGLVGVVMGGDVELSPIVSQGCRPIGSPLLITDGQDNVIRCLGSRPAVEVVQETIAKLPEADRRLAQTALLVGVVIDEYKTDFLRGDFLIRNLIGVDPSNGYLIINDRVILGQTIQFQVRDARSATEDLSYLLAHNQALWGERQPAAAAIFNCNGRGIRMFPAHNHDIDLIHQSVGKIPAAGFFCAGEIGPIGNKSFIHGFTSSIGFFLPKESSVSVHPHPIS